MCSLGGALIRINPAWETRLGWPISALPGKSIEEILSASSFATLSKILNERESGDCLPVTLDFRMTRGDFLNCSTSIVIDSEKMIFSGVARPIVQNAEEQATRWRLALEGAEAGFWDWDLITGEVVTSSRYKKILGYEDHEFEPSFESWKKRIHPDDLERAVENLKDFMASDSRTLRSEFRMRTKSGEYRWMHFGGAVERDAKGKPIRMTGWMFDVHEIYSARQRLAESEARSKALIEAIPDLMFVMTRDGDYLEVHASNPDLLLAKKEDLLGRNVREFFPSDLANRFLKLTAAAVDEKKMKTIEYVLDLPGGPTYFEGRITSSSRENEVLLVLRDQTDLKKAQESMRDQQAAMSASSRLAALGEMAGGIAHEINNPLAVAHAHASRLGDAARGGKVDKDMIIQSTEKIESVCLRISRIIAGLRTLARDGERDMFIDATVGSIVNDALSVCTERMKHLSINLTTNLDHFAGETLECRPVQISQVLINLLSNAQHAVEERTTYAPGERWIRVDCVDRGPDIDIRVTDSGAGIPRGIQDRIFDPFFTTKDVGKGTGLGLSVSASIIRDHGGRLFLDKGSPATRFVVRLPKHQAHNP